MSGLTVSYHFLVSCPDFPPQPDVLCSSSSSFSLCLTPPGGEPVNCHFCLFVCFFFLLDPLRPINTTFVCCGSHSGVNCEINEDDCASNPCKYGDCQDGINEYKCVCAPGYTGSFCRVEIHLRSSALHFSTIPLSDSVPESLSLKEPNVTRTSTSAAPTRV